MRLLIFAVLTLLPSIVESLEIVSQSLERFERERRIVATGNVTVRDRDFELKADTLVYHEESGEIEAYGNVYFSDDSIDVWAKEGVFNVEKKTGTVKGALINIRKQEIWIQAEEIERLDEIRFRAKGARFSTCKPEPSTSEPWCITSQSVELIVDEVLIGRMNTFRVKDIPIFFSPLFWGPGGAARKSGFLPLRIGNSNRAGFRLSPSYYLVIDSSKDLTFYLDYFSKIGLGKGVELRYLTFDQRGMWYGYHIYDNQIGKNYFELRGSHIERLRSLNLLVDVNFVNRGDYYRRYGDLRAYNPSFLFKEIEKDFTGRYERLLQSSSQVSLPFENSRLYLLGQAYKELKGEGKSPPLKIETGYTLYPLRFGAFSLNLELKGGYYYQEHGLRTARIEVSPMLYHSFGDPVRVSQSLSFSQIFYSPRETAHESHGRAVVRYEGKVFTRIIKRKSGFFHLLEPYLEGDFVKVSGRPPILSEKELIDDTAIVKAGILSSLSFPNFSFHLKIAQSYDFNQKYSVDRLYPVLIEGKVESGRLALYFDSFQNLRRGSTESFNSAVNYSVSENTSFTITQRYTKEGAFVPYSFNSPTWRDPSINQAGEGIKYFGLNLTKELTKRLSISASINYSAKGEGLRDSSLNLRYAEQCWVGNLQLKRKPVEVGGRQTSEYSFIVFFELKGLGTVRVYERSSAS